MRLCVAFFPTFGRAILILLTPLLLAGCVASDRLTFPERPHSRTDDEIRYDVRRTGRPDFALHTQANGTIDRLLYDDDHDGTWDRVYRLADYAPDRVPHLIVLLDSIPYDSALKFWESGHLRFFPRPQMVIGTFPTLSPVIFNRILGAPPRLGTNNKFYDPRIDAMHGRFWEQVGGGKEPWQRYLHYDADYTEEGLGFIKPREVYGLELARMRQSLDASPDRVTIVYAVSAAGMACKFGAEGIDECLAGVERLCLQLLYERQGAIKISIMADHGHNKTASRLVSAAEPLSRAGFRVTDSIAGDRDVVADAEGLVTYVGLHTRKPAAVADAMLGWAPTELAMYLEKDRVIVRDQRGAAAIDRKGDRLRYAAISADVLDHLPVMERLKREGKLDADGYATSDDWFDATVDHAWPDAVPRVWEAFHGLVGCPPDVMLTLHDGYVSGLPSMEMWIKMASSHGGLNQLNSATFLMSMTGRADRPLRSGDVLRTIEPSYVPSVRVRH